MSENEHSTTAELVFQLGKTTRRALDRTNGTSDPVALARLASGLLEAGDDRIAPDLLMLFVAGFEEGDPPERRSDPDNR